MTSFSYHSIKNIIINAAFNFYEWDFLLNEQ